MENSFLPRDGIIKSISVIWEMLQTKDSFNWIE
jgi:hypothetical protein